MKSLTCSFLQLVLVCLMAVWAHVYSEDYLGCWRIAEGSKLGNLLFGQPADAEELAQGMLELESLCQSSDVSTWLNP
jgi:hypothetical protein